MSTKWRWILNQGVLSVIEGCSYFLAYSFTYGSSIFFMEWYNAYAGGNSSVFVFNKNLLPKNESTPSVFSKRYGKKILREVSEFIRIRFLM